MNTAAPLQNSAAKSQSQSTSAHRGLLLQRKCGCGSPTASLTAECAECKSTKRLQTKFAIGASNDPLEQEADRVADQVLAAPANPAVSGAPPHIQRFMGQPSAAAGTAPASVDHVLARSGRPLEPALRQDMEQRFGHDFSRVRVHSDRAAEQSARDVNAHAYTVGQNIVFGADRFSPGTHEGRRLLAHELTHVVQQSSRVPFDRDAQGHSGTLSKQVASQPKKAVNLALYQEDPTTKKFFSGLATIKANQIGAKQFPTEDDSDNPYLCPAAAKTAPIPFSSGAEIVNAIRNAYMCTEQQVSQIHIFSHSWNYGLFGVDNAESERRGLYATLEDTTLNDILAGARAVSDVPTYALNQDAVFVMHGCGTAGGSDSFAQKLLAAIIGTSPKARVYGHSALSTCGQDSDWKEFNASNPAGKFIKVNPYHKPSPPKK